MIANTFKPVTGPIEKLIEAQPVIFTLIILYQGLFSGNAVKIPGNLQVLFDSKTFRFMSLLLIAFSATKDIEYALLSSLLFLGVLYLLKTPEEREETGFI
jgi:hypothetical protein